MSRVLVLGSTGMVGNAMFRVLSESEVFDTYGTARSYLPYDKFTSTEKEWIVPGVDVLDIDVLLSVIGELQPDVIVNCTGIIKQLSIADDPLQVLPINSIFPQRLSLLCASNNIRLVQFGTDCSFSGKKGNYNESDISDAEDLYGKSKYIGEIHDKAHAITLRTSTLGHELIEKNGLLEWFLAQEVSVKGYRKAIFTGLPTNEIARVVRDEVLPDSTLHGLYHVSSKSINKFNLLTLISETYKKKINIESDDTVVIDRSLDSTRFTDETGYVAAEWPELISNLYSYYIRYFKDV